MTEVTFLEHCEVRLVDVKASDMGVAEAAKISLAEHDPIPDEKVEGLINYLMQHRHGTPFEHNMFKFYVKAPIFVFREFHRHRIGFSYNEMSGRYTTLLPEFYMPALDRPMVKTGTSARPTFIPADPKAAAMYRGAISANSLECWAQYQDLLNADCPNEVARLVLPLNIMSQMYVTCNARSLMAFLSLRVHSETAQFVSYPQHEIQMVAEQMEKYLHEFMPLTHIAFQLGRRVAP